jgi:hypothetical protein
MSCLGVHFAISPEDLERFRSTIEEHDILALIREDIEERYLGGEWAYQTDKAWDAIHRCLTDGTLDLDAGEYPLKLCILGGDHLYSKSDYIASLIEPGKVRDVATALAGVTRQVISEAYMRINPDEYGLDLSNDDLEYTWETFQGLPAFFAKAAQAGRAVLFTADQ